MSMVERESSQKERMSQTADDLRNFGARIRQAREEAGLTLREVAAQLDKSVDAIGRYESGSRAPRITELPVLARTLKVPISYFFGEDAPDITENDLIRELSGRTESTSGTAILNDLFRTILENKDLTPDELAAATGVGVGAIQSLLYKTLDNKPVQIDPFVLRKVAEIFNWDQIFLFQLAGYLDTQLEPRSASTEAQFIAYCFDRLPKARQHALLSGFTKAMASAGLRLEKERIQQLEESVKQLQEQYPIFDERPFGLRREIGRIVGNVTRTSTKDIFLRGVSERINGSLGRGTENVSHIEIEAVLKQPDVQIVLNLLLPRREIPGGLEKLYWIMYDADTAGKRTETLPQSYRNGIKALWGLLEETARTSKNTNPA